MAVLLILNLLRRFTTEDDDIEIISLVGMCEGMKTFSFVGSITNVETVSTVFKVVSVVGMCDGKKVFSFVGSIPIVKIVSTVFKVVSVVGMFEVVETVLLVEVTNNV